MSSRTVGAAGPRRCGSLVRARPRSGCERASCGDEPSAPLCIRVTGVDPTHKVTRRFCESASRRATAGPAAHGDLTDSFVPSFREPFLDNSRSEPLGAARTRKEVAMVLKSPAEAAGVAGRWSNSWGGACERGRATGTRRWGEHAVAANCIDVSNASVRPRAGCLRQKT